MGVRGEEEGEDYVLVWSDEFDGPTIDRKNWDFEINCWGGGNNEKQCYVDNPETYSLQDGSLVFHPRYYPQGYKGKLQNCTDNTQDSCTWTQPFTSTRIRSLHSMSWKYGKFEFRAKLPSGDFLWPAIWMLPTDSVYGSWAASGEIDLVEFKGQKAWNTRILHTLHHGGKWPDNTHTGITVDTHSDLTAQFYNYTFTWTHESMAWYVDGTRTYEQFLNKSWWGGIGTNPYTGNYQPWDQRFYLILNLAIAGNFFPPGEFGVFNATAALPTWTSQYEIDYVRIYQPAVPPLPPAPAPSASPSVSPSVSPNPSTPTPPSPPAFNINLVWEIGGGVVGFIALVLVAVCLYRRERITYKELN
eukprot:TRINITY_DN5615_c0_g3_i1.p1 TRINITY_DN5615_c0_g3~~TRINITY_DN5615_c0_g3_i1.p1  ORF type:complete len:376 (-),score=45.29 TRINITY_DN5615_c0_g3_i1:42-1115(-)